MITKLLPKRNWSSMFLREKTELQPFANFPFSHELVMTFRLTSCALPYKLQLAFLTLHFLLILSPAWIHFSFHSWAVLSDHLPNCLYSFPSWSLFCSRFFSAISYRCLITQWIFTVCSSLQNKPPSKPFHFSSTPQCLSLLYALSFLSPFSFREAVRLYFYSLSFSIYARFIQFGKVRSSFLTTVMSAVFGKGLLNVVLPLKLPSADFVQANDKHGANATAVLRDVDLEVEKGFCRTLHSHDLRCNDDSNQTVASSPKFLGKSQGLSSFHSVFRNAEVSETLHEM